MMRNLTSCRRHYSGLFVGFWSRYYWYQSFVTNSAFLNWICTLALDNTHHTPPSTRVRITEIKHIKNTKNDKFWAIFKSASNAQRARKKSTRCKTSWRWVLEFSDSFWSLEFDLGSNPNQIQVLKMPDRYSYPLILLQIISRGDIFYFLFDK